MLSSGLRVLGLRCCVLGLGCWVPGAGWCAGFTVQGSEFTVHGSGFTVDGSAAVAEPGTQSREPRTVNREPAVLRVGVLKFVGPPPHGFLIRIALILAMLAVTTVAVFRGQSRPITVASAALGGVLLAWYARE